jgi:hypothetical protein
MMFEVKNDGKLIITWTRDIHLFELLLDGGDTRRLQRNETNVLLPDNTILQITTLVDKVPNNLNWTV